MKCRVCGGQANIRLPQYNTALCASDFTSFFEKRVSDTIKRYGLFTGHDKVLIAVSGGKDSLSLWHLADRIGFPADAIYIDLGITDYSRVSLEKTVKMAERLQKRLISFSLAETFSKGIQELARIVKRPPCSLCGTVKRYVMNRAATEYGYSVLATGHNLDDEASALLGNVLHWKEEYLWKKGVLLREAHGLARKVKPFFLCSEKEAAAYALINKIDYVYEECPYSKGAKSLLYKALLNKVEDVSPATKIAFVKGYLKRAGEEGAKQEEGERVPCSVCGYPSYGAKCGFCRLFERFGFGAGLRFHLHGR